MKWLNPFLAAFWLLWTAVILPLHTPGVVPMSPDAASIVRVPVCPLCIALGRDKQSPRPVTPPASGCALCDIKAKLYTGPVICLDLRPAGLVESFPLPRPTLPEQETVIFHFRSRAPPAILPA